MHLRRVVPKGTAVGLVRRSSHVDQYVCLFDRRFGLHDQLKHTRSHILTHQIFKPNDDAQPMPIPNNRSCRSFLRLLVDPKRQSRYRQTTRRPKPIEDMVEHVLTSVHTAIRD